MIYKRNIDFILRVCLFFSKSLFEDIFEIIKNICKTECAFVSNLRHLLGKRRHFKLLGTTENSKRTNRGRTDALKLSSSRLLRHINYKRFGPLEMVFFSPQKKPFLRFSDIQVGLNPYRVYLGVSGWG